MSNRIDLTRFIALADKMAAAHDEMGLEGMGIHHAEAHSALLEAIAELKRCYEKIDWLQQAADLAAAQIGRKNWDGFEESMYEAGLWERPSE